MSAEDRAEERAMMELKLKVDTLFLEKEKFIYTRAVGFTDRLGVALVRVSSALLIAIGTTILWGLSSYKTLIDIVSKGTVNHAILLLTCGFLLAVMTFCAALTISVGPGDPMKADRVQGWLLILHGISGMLAFGAFGLAIFLIIRELR